LNINVIRHKTIFAHIRLYTSYIDELPTVTHTGDDKKV